MTSTKLNQYCSRLLNKLAYKVGAPFGRPTQALILFTNRCNARCLHCHSWKLKQNDPEMTTEEWKRTLRELREWLGPAEVSFTGGETFLRKDTIDIVQYASSLGFWVEILTNGYLMDKTQAEKLARSGVNRVTISLDSSRPEIHDEIRGREGFFEKATWSLRALAEERDRCKQDVEIWAKTTIMKPNVGDITNIPALVKDLRATGVLFQALSPTYYTEQLSYPNWYKYNTLWVTDMETLSSGIRKLKELKGQGYPILNSLENLDLIESYFKEPEQKTAQIRTHEYEKDKNECRTWIDGLQIMPDGGMKMCYSMEPFANAKDGNIRKAWWDREQCWKKPCPYYSK